MCFISPMSLNIVCDDILVADKGYYWHADAGKGSVSLRDLQRVSVAHDFIWTDDELFDMIHCFDSDGDGKVSICCLDFFFEPCFFSHKFLSVLSPI